MSADRVAAAADWLLAARRERRRFMPFPPEIAPRSADEAYAVQAALVARLDPSANRPAGAKIALSTPVMQKMCNYDRPVAGVILAGTAFGTGQRIALADHHRLGVECEIAVRIGRPLGASTRPHTVASVSDAVAALHCAIELVDDRDADYSALDAMVLIGDNALSAGIVLGPEIADWRRLDLTALSGRFVIDGEPTESGRSSDPMGGHPFAAVAWLADHLAARGEGLAPGQIVMTGSLVRTRFPKAGQTVIAEIDGLGQAIAHFT